MEDNKTPLNLSSKRNEPSTSIQQKHSSSSTQLTIQPPTTSYNQLVDIQYTSTQKIKVEKCNPDFFFRNFKQSYPMYKNPRGLCLIINIYQIHQMPPRRWSERDTDALRQLFEELMFSVRLYTDSTHDLTANNLKKIIKEFSQSKEHEQAQCCVICLMSHGEEGFLTSKDGDKILLDELFSMFNNVNCPYLAGKPKLFFIQSCRDDPISGPAEDIGIRISTSQTNMQTSVTKCGDEADGHQTNDNIISHVPSLSDMLIGFPTQKGYIAYRKPEIGSWYMNAIVQIFSKHAKNTDLCAMLNMVNAMISKEVTNNGKKQMSEYTSKFTKPYLFFYPGLYLDTDNLASISSTTIELPFDSHYLTIAATTTSKNNKRQKVECDNKTSQLKLDENNYVNLKHKPCNNKQSTTFVRYNLSLPSLLLAANNQNNNENAKSDNEKFTLNHKEILTHKHKMLIANKGRQYWKVIAREMDLSEAQINEIDYTNETNDLTQRLYDVINCWVNDNGHTKATLSRLLQILSICKLNSIRDEIISDIQQAPNHSIIDEIQ